MGIDADLTARTQLVRAWMLLADGKTATARRMFADLPAEFWGRFGLAEATLASGQPGPAALFFAEAELMWRERPLPLRAPAIARRAVCLARTGEPEYAAYLCESALFELVDPVPILWLSCAGVAVWPNPRRTVVAKRALAIAEGVDFRAAADLYHQLADTLRRRGQQEEAVAVLDRAIELLARTRLNPGLGRCHLVRAQELAAQGALAEAIDHARRALALCGDEALCHLADLHRQAKRYEEAERFAQRAQDSAIDKSQLGRATRVLGQIAADATPAKAEILLHSAADTYARAGDSLEVAETLRVLGLFLADRGRLREAVSCFDQACATVLAPRSPRS